MIAKIVPIRKVCFLSVSYFRIIVFFLVYSNLQFIYPTRLCLYRKYIINNRLTLNYALRRIFPVII